VPSPEAHGINTEIEQANGDTTYSQQPRRHIGVDQRVQVVQEKPTLIRADASAGSQPIFCRSQRTWPGQNFNEHTPDQGAEVEPTRERPSTREKSSEHDPKDEEEVQDQNPRGRYGIEIQTSLLRGLSHFSLPILSLRRSEKRLCRDGQL
jgi:hypothetical protein